LRFKGEPVRSTVPLHRRENVKKGYDRHTVSIDLGGIFFCSDVPLSQKTLKIENLLHNGGVPFMEWIMNVNKDARVAYLLTLTEKVMDQLDHEEGYR